jgi:hypothetical protein
METSKSPGSSPQPQVKSRRPKRWQFGLLALLLLVGGIGVCSGDGGR